MRTYWHVGSRESVTFKGFWLSATTATPRIHPDGMVLTERPSGEQIIALPRRSRRASGCLECAAKKAAHSGRVDGNIVTSRRSSPSCDRDIQASGDMWHSE
jgi:hypothetical protein